MNKQELIEKLTEYVNRYEAVTDEYYQGRHGAYGVALKLVKQLDEPQKPVVPKFVADWIFYAKDKGWNFARSIRETESETGDVLVTDWYDAHSSIYARAWLDGYEVEKEPLYYVKLPSTYNTFLVESDDGDLIVWQNTTRGTPFTEKRIKAIDERYWAFAVKVEEVEG
ncbi:DUF1642 domain-containing protein [Enterococcus thailandicus]|nr:DUF1642 domain-containing protein [Listeria monocytogenes]